MSDPSTPPPPQPRVKSALPHEPGHGLPLTASAPVGVAQALAEAATAACAREQLSALLDGACPEPLRAGQVARCATDPGLRRDWARYHWIGEHLRAADAPAWPGSNDFADAVLARLAHEAAPASAAETLLAAAAPSAAAAPAKLSTQPRQAANDALWRWKALAGAASVAALAVLAWPMLGLVPGGGTAQFAAAPALAVPQAAVLPLPAGPDATGLANAVGVQAAVWRDPQLGAMLSAHREWGGVNALHVPAGFLRNATYEPPSP